MPNLKYVAKRIAGMNFGAMLDTARTVKERTGRGVLPTLVDMAACGFKYQAGYMDYLVFEFYHLTADQRKTYIARQKQRICAPFKPPRALAPARGQG